MMMSLQPSSLAIVDREDAAQATDSIDVRPSSRKGNVYKRTGTKAMPPSEKPSFGNYP
jgi:hypothetical protein